MSASSSVLKPMSIGMSLLLASVFSLLSPRIVAAQELVPGVRIRSWVAPPGEWHTGTLVRLGRDSLVIQRCHDCAAEAQPWAGVTRLEVGDGTTWSGKHMALGALVVGGLAAWLDARKVNRDISRCHDGPCGLAVLEIPVVGVLGALGGTIMGAFWRVESWRDVDIVDARPLRR